MATTENLIKDYYDSLSDYQKERFDKCKAQAEVFFAQKERKKYYPVTGYDFHSERDIDAGCYLSMTDEEVNQLKSFLIEEYQKFEPDDPIHNWQEFMETDPSMAVPFFEALNEKANLWNDLVYTEVEGNYIVPTHIDFDDFRYFYRFSYYHYDTINKEMKGPASLFVSLTDEEYILLLTLQQFENRGFTFNRLISIAPEIIKKIDLQAQADFMNTRIPDQWDFETYTIVFSEIINDAKEICE